MQRFSFLVISILFLSFHLSAQSCLPDGISLNSQEEIDNFAINYPGCTEILGDLYINGASNLNGLSQIESVGGTLHITQSPITSMEGLENLQTIGENFWFIGNLNIDDFTGLNSLMSIGGGFEVAFSNLISYNGLENLLSIGGTLSSQKNSQLENTLGLENLVSIGGLSFFENHSLISLVGLENITTFSGHLELNDCPILVNLDGLNNLQSVGKLTINGTGIYDFTGLDNLMSIDSSDLTIGFNFNLSNLNGLHNLTKVNGTVLIAGNNVLEDISALGNVDPTTVNLVSLAGNDMLNDCANNLVCAAYDSEILDLFSNGLTCILLEDVFAACNELPKVHFRLYNDLNLNKIYDQGEPSVPGASVVVEPLGLVGYAEESEIGKLFLQEGDYTLAFNHLGSSDWLLSSDSFSYEITVDASTTSDTFSFGLNPKIDKSEVQACINSGLVRCNEVVNFDVGAKNLGTGTVSGTLWLTVDENIMSQYFIDQPDTIVEPHQYGWHFTDLYPGFGITRVLQLTIPGPLDFPLGDPLFFNAYVDFVDANGVQQSQTFEYAPIVECSYDPNDKLVFPNREGAYTLFDETLVYTIRFQNTGNAEAYDVVIRDTLDVNVDPMTFRVLGSSHASILETTLEEDRYLTFSFIDIFLPDSTTDFDGSQGYVSYLIKGVEGLEEMTPIENRAGIYFDFNPPVITNTTQNLMVSELPTVSTENLSNEAHRIRLFPNPGEGLFYLEGDDLLNAQVELSDASGRVILRNQLDAQQSLDLYHLPEGLYLLKVTTPTYRAVKKLILSAH